MIWKSFAAVAAMLTVAVPAAAQPLQSFGRDGAWSTYSIERWVQQLENELDHLEDNFYFQRRSQPSGLRRDIDRASRAVAKFHVTLRREDDRDDLIDEFEDMDRQIHRLVDRLNQSGDLWLRRQAQRIRYPDEQLHYALRIESVDRRSLPRELLARHSHVLEIEARNLRELVQRVDRRDDRLRDSLDDFVDEAENFREDVEDGDDHDDLQDAFRDLDEEWHQVIERINRSSSGVYLRRAAQSVNHVHNQVHDILIGSGVRHEEAELREQVGPRRPIELRRRIERRDDRPGVEIDLPNLGRFRIPF